jgi:hypothetical protein
MWLGKLTVMALDLMSAPDEENVKSSRDKTLILSEKFQEG